MDSGSLVDQTYIPRTKSLESSDVGRITHREPIGLLKGGSVWVVGMFEIGIHYMSWSIAWTILMAFWNAIKKKFIRRPKVFFILGRMSINIV